MGTACAAQVLHRESERWGAVRGIQAAEGGHGEATAANGRRFRVTVLTRNGAGFRLIPREIAWKDRGFFAAGLTD